MPQQSLFGGFALTTLDLHVQLSPDGPGGTVTFTVQDWTGQVNEAGSVTWRKDRDVTDLGHVFKAITEAFLWGEHGAATKALNEGAKRFLPKVPAAGRTP